MGKRPFKCRITGLLLAGLLLVLGVTLHAKAANQEDFELKLAGESTVTLSEPFTVTVMLHLPERLREQGATLYSSQFEIRYDSARLVFAERNSQVGTGFDLTVRGPESGVPSSVLISSLVEDRQGMAVTEGMCLAELVFSPKSEGNCVLTVADVKLHDLAGNTFPVQTGSLTVSVQKEEGTGQNQGGSASGGGGGASGGGGGAGGSLSTEVSLRFETNGGTPLAARTEKPGTVISLAEIVPTKEGCAFEGWYLDSSLTRICTSVTLREDVTVYAKWSSLPVAEQELNFTDVAKQDWFYSDVLWAFREGLMNGVAETTFAPNENASRGMVVTILHRMEGSPQAENTGATFSDVPKNAYYAKAVAWALEENLITGYGDGRFGPNDSITREQFISILYRSAASEGETTKGTEQGLESYADAGRVSPYAVPPMLWACKTGLIQGDNGLLMPKEQATRAQIAAILHRFSKTQERN